MLALVTLERMGTRAARSLADVDGVNVARGPCHLDFLLGTFWTTRSLPTQNEEPLAGRSRVDLEEGLWRGWPETSKPLLLAFLGYCSAGLGFDLFA